MLIIAALLTIAIGIIHSVLGERCLMMQHHLSSAGLA